MEMLAFDGWSSRSESDLLRACWWHDHRTVGLLDFWQKYTAYCQICHAMKAMRVVDGVDKNTLDTHEHVLCNGCGLNPRIRTVLDLLQTQAGLREDSHVYMMEQVTKTYVWMQKHLPCAVTGSEYEADARKRKQLTTFLQQMGGSGEVVFNDVTSSRYADGMFDAVVSLEVLEHIPDYRKALSEFARNLKDGGSLIATFPFADTPETIVRARLDEQGNIEHLLEPEYHGDTISGGILCWYHFGWDILEACIQSGFRSARMVMPWNPAACMYYGLWILVAKK